MDQARFCRGVVCRGVPGIIGAVPALCENAPYVPCPHTRRCRSPFVCVRVRAQGPVTPAICPGASGRPAVGVRCVFPCRRAQAPHRVRPPPPPQRSASWPHGFGNGFVPLGAWPSRVRATLSRFWIQQPICDFLWASGLWAHDAHTVQPPPPPPLTVPLVALIPKSGSRYF